MTQASLTPSQRRASLALRSGIALQASTLAWLAWRHGTSVDSLLFMELGTSEALAGAVDRALSTVSLLAALCLLVAPQRGAALMVLPVSAAFLIEALALRTIGGRAYAELAPVAHATRWLAPLALLWLRTPPSDVATGRASWILRVAVVATFCTHGFEAWRQHPAFVDLLIGSARRWTDSAPTEDTARLVLIAIAVLDGLVALALVVGGFTARWRWIALWATLWGLLTAAARPVALGPEFVHEGTIRALNGLAPLALWYLSPRPEHT